MRVISNTFVVKFPTMYTLFSSSITHATLTSLIRLNPHQLFNTQSQLARGMPSLPAHRLGSINTDPSFALTGNYAPAAAASQQKGSLSAGNSLYTAEKSRMDGDHVSRQNPVNGNALWGKRAFSKATPSSVVSSQVCANT